MRGVVCGCPSMEKNASPSASGVLAKTASASASHASSSAVGAVLLLVDIVPAVENVTAVAVFLLLLVGVSNR